MQCNISDIIPSKPGYGWIIKSCIYSVLLVVIIVGNAALYQRTNAQSHKRKWNATMFLIKLLSMCGIFNALVNVTASVVHTLSGESPVVVVVMAGALVMCKDKYIFYIKE